LPDQAEIHRKCTSRDIKDRQEAARLLDFHFSNPPDKDQAWKDLARLTQDECSDVRGSATQALGAAFEHVPDKDQAWKDLARLTQDEDSFVRWRAAQALGAAFEHVPDKDQAWKDLARLTQDEDRSVRGSAAQALGAAFSHVPDKDQAWKDLHRLTQDEDRSVRWSAAQALGAAFGNVLDKDQARKDLHRLTQDEDSSVRWNAAQALGAAFSHVPDKDQAWKDLARLTQDEDRSVRGSAAEALGAAFGNVQDKDQAWKDLHRLTQDEDSSVRESAAQALGAAFSHVPDKDQAWKDLHRMTQDESSFVRGSVAQALGAAFSHVPDKDQAWKDLHRMTQDWDGNVRMSAYHSLGRATIFKATLAKDSGILKSELENAVVYFEKSTQESGFSPASFCHPFYRAYLATTFQEAKEDEVQKYLAEAKRAVGSSKSKDELLKTVENLAGALKEAQSLKNRSFQDVARELNTYQWYCENAAKYMAAAEDEAPGAVRLMRKCNPIIEEKIQFIINEIQEKARQICQITHGSGTEFEAPGVEINQAATGLSTGDLVSIQRSSSSIVNQLKKFCRLLPEKEKDQVCRDVEEIESEADFPENLHLIDRALFNLEPILKSHRTPLVDVVILTVLQEEYSRVLAKLSGLGPPQHMGSDPNIYAWRFGEAFCPNRKGAYKVAVGMIVRAGDIQSALAAKDAISRWRPNYLIFSGIAGGLPGSALKKGDVIIADCIYGYEYGKIEETFKPRGNWTFKTDQGLLTGAIAYALQESWRDHIKAEPPEECEPKVISGEIASGEKVIDDPSNEFFIQVIKQWPKVKAVEMEGAGIGSAIDQAQSLKIPIGFMVIRAISDLPRPEEDGDKTRGTEERDAWKTYASDVAAAFTIGWIADGLPLPPSTGI
jgi:HEAT repeat protein/nucleoside phosphorylase